MLEELTQEAQEVLDELWAEKLIPFKLSAGKVTEGIGEYAIRFNDCPFHLVHVPLTEEIEFRQALRVAVLKRVARISGQVKKPTRAVSN